MLKKPLPELDEFFNDGSIRVSTDHQGNATTEWLPESKVGNSSFFIEGVTEHAPALLVSLWGTKEAVRLVRSTDIVLADGIQFRLTTPIDVNHFRARPLVGSEDLRVRAQILRIVEERESRRTAARVLSELVEETVRRLDARHSFDKESAT